MPAQGSPVTGCCSSHHTSRLLSPLFIGRQLWPASSMCKTALAAVPAKRRRGSLQSVTMEQRKPAACSSPDGCTSRLASTEDVCVTELRNRLASRQLADAASVASFAQARGVRYHWVAQQAEVAQR